MTIEVKENERQFLAAVIDLLKSDYKDVKYTISPIEGEIKIHNKDDLTDQEQLQLGTTLGALAAYFKVE
ncbi:MAG: hypothetical protein H3Z50_07695 [archaeon]|nr:hypothetical protein [archaeon]